MRRLRWTVLAVFILTLVFPAVFAAENEGPATVASKTEGLEHRPGLLDMWVDAAAGKVFLQLPAPDPDGEVGRFLYLEGLVTGLGSNPVGLDRGQLGGARVVALRHVGNKVMMIQPNLAFRATTDNARERDAVAQSFARSVLWAGEPVARDPDGTTLIDITSLLLDDAHRVAARLESSGQGSFRLDAGRSSVDLARCLAFPDNLEFEALLTWSGEKPGPEVNRVTPTPQSVSLYQHLSLIRLPDDGYRPRAFDPRAGSFSIDYADYAVPLDQPMDQRWIVRHRLEKTKPGAARSPVKQPIVYYVDGGAPEPVRSALIDGASWWAEAFEAAGFENAFEVRVLPEDVHPQDVRYNVIQWVHRQTRGWSYGGGVVDPRTGERIQGHVWLGSLRVRQDRLLFEGLLGVEKTGSGRADDPTQLALARIRQLAAHEVGHALGFSHNFAASTYGDRASVMDYPHPLVRARGGKLDVKSAYGVGIGEWDRHAVRYAHAEFDSGADEADELRKIVDEGIRLGYRFLTDSDARPDGAAHPLAALWDNGADSLDELAEVVRVRQTALAQFGPANLAPGRPLALLEEVLAPVYFYHRYQLQAVGKLVGGVDYDYNVNGDDLPPLRVVEANRQQAALEAMIDLLDPVLLDIPEEVLALLTPRPNGYRRNRELFDGNTAPLFDALGAAGTAADLVVRELLQPERAARLVDQQRRDAGMPGLAAVVAAIVAGTFETSHDNPRHAAIADQVRLVVARRMIALSSNRAASAAVRAGIDAGLRSLAGRLEGADDPTLLFIAGEIGRYLDRPFGDDASRFAPPEEPPGSPIGTLGYERSGCSWE